MPPIKAISANDGPRITVNDWIKDPRRIPATILDMTKQGFLADAVLRDAGNTESGAVRFDESTPLYSGDDLEIRSEYSEVPVGETFLGTPRVVFAEERSRAVMISDETQRRNNIDRVRTSLTQVKNTMVRTWDRAFLGAVMDHPRVPRITLASFDPTKPGVLNKWGDKSYDIRSDINKAREIIETARPEGIDAEFDFEADTLIVGTGTKYDLLGNDQFAKPFAGNIADENLQYTGKLPQKVQTLDVLVSKRVPVGRALVLQRKTVGFISDEVSLRATPLYRDEPRKTWRSDVQRASAIGIDQPLCCVVIEGV